MRRPDGKGMIVSPRLSAGAVCSQSFVSSAGPRSPGHITKLWTWTISDCRREPKVRCGEKGETNPDLPWCRSFRDQGVEVLGYVLGPPMYSSLLGDNRFGWPMTRVVNLPRTGVMGAQNYGVWEARPVPSTGLNYVGHRINQFLDGISLFCQWH